MDDVLIVGAGLIGSMIALRMAQAGARVTVVDKAGPGGGASGASFGWINASFYHDAAHHHLRVAGIAAYQRLAETMPGLSVTWQSCLWYEEQGDALEQMQADLTTLGYPVARIDREEFASLSPGVAAPDAALHFKAEAVTDPAALNRAVVQAAEAAGARFVLGCAVTGLLRGGAVCGVTTALGEMRAQQVVVAAGTGAAGLIGVPMLHRPGLLLQTQTVPPLLAHVLVTPVGEIKQDAAGQIVMPTVAGHQGDQTETLAQTPQKLAEEAMIRLRSVLPDQELHWTRISHALRPVPQDGLPVIGAVEPGLYAAVMHSGVTLAAITGELVTQELGGGLSNLLGPYRPTRFT